jgi:hypothetical protein
MEPGEDDCMLMLEFALPSLHKLTVQAVAVSLK